MEASKQIRSATSILLHVIILFSFLSIFFFYYISKIESDAFKDELGGLLKDNVNKLLDENPAIIPYFATQRPYINRFTKRYETETRATLQHNMVVKFSAVFLILILMGILLTVVLTMSFECGKNINIGSILVENIIVFIFIGIVEYTFFTKVASKYIPVAPSLMIDTIINTAKERMKNEN